MYGACAGNIWIYSVYGRFSANEGDDTYCHPMLYWFAFWATTLTWLIVGLFLVLACAIACCAAFIQPN